MLAVDADNSIKGEDRIDLKNKINIFFSLDPLLFTRKSIRAFVLCLPDVAMHTENNFIHRQLNPQKKVLKKWCLDH